MIFSVDDVNELLRYLRPRVERMLRMYYGIGEERVTLEEIGKRFQLSRERVRQILRSVNHASFVKGQQEQNEYSRRKEAEQQQAEIYEKNPRSIPYGECVYFRNNHRWARIYYHSVEKLSIRTLGDLADYTPEQLRIVGHLSFKGIKAVAELLHYFGIPYDLPVVPRLPQIKKTTAAEIMNNWQAFLLS